VPRTGIEGSWFLAQSFATGDPNWIVPVQSLKEEKTSFVASAFKALGAGYPDQELIAAIVGGRIDPRDSLPDGDVFFGSNHKSGLEAWRFVTKANEVEKEKRHLFGFPTGASPPIFPAMYAPTGAVHKKTRQGDI
jgi:hypothetical protein